MPPAGFETTIPASELQQTYAFVRTSTKKNIYTEVLINPYPDQEGNKLMCRQHGVNFLRRLALQEKQYDSSRLDVFEIARVPEMLPNLFPSRSG